MRLRIDVDIRRKSDTEALAAKIEELFRAHTVGPDADLDIRRVMPKRRGGHADFWATIDVTRDEAYWRGQRIAETINSNANLIDRIDWFRVVAFDGDHLVGFTEGDFRGWMREAALEELA
jgi:hypothetical protein